MLMALCGIVAFAVDLGYLAISKTELQRSADSAAMAATWDLLNKNAEKMDFDMTQEISSARTTASQYAGLNKVCTQAPNVDLNAGNSIEGDVVVGYISQPQNPNCVMSYSDSNRFNSVQVRVQRTDAENGEVPLFFAKIFGWNSQSMTAQATAALINNVGGFRAPSDGGNLGILPFALDEGTWNGLMAGGGTDSWRWNDTTKKIEAGSDGVREVNLYPQGTGSPGNRGTIDIGGSNNSTSDIARQITDGISPQDFKDLGKPLVLDINGNLTLNGDTGISAGVKDELASIKGQPRVIPIFRTVIGPGNNATYTIVKFVGVRILDVKLTGSMSSKKVIIQPARVVIKGGVPATTAGTSYCVYSPVWLVR